MRMPLFLLFMIWFAPLEAQSKNITPADFSHCKADEAWWVGVRFKATNKEILGLPVNEISKDWKFASLLMKESIPRQYLFEGGSDVLKTSHLAFSKHSTFTNSGKKELALVGVYEKVDGKSGSFVLVLQERPGGHWKKLYVYTWNEPGFLAIDTQGSGFTVWFCMECDGHQSFEWDKRKLTFNAITEPDED